MACRSDRNDDPDQANDGGRDAKLCRTGHVAGDHGDLCRRRGRQDFGRGQGADLPACDRGLRANPSARADPGSASRPDRSPPPPRTPQNSADSHPVGCSLNPRAQSANRAPTWMLSTMSSSPSSRSKLSRRKPTKPATRSMNWASRRTLKSRTSSASPKVRISGA